MLPARNVVPSHCARPSASRHWIRSVAKPGYENIHELVRGFEGFRKSMRTSNDAVYRYISFFFEVCETFFLFNDCVACADQLGCEMLMKHHQPIFYLCKMTNYKEVVWSNMDSLYGSETSIVERETVRRNLFVRVTKGKNCNGTDTLGEIHNKDTVGMNKSKSVENCVSKSASVRPASQAKQWAKRNILLEEPKPPKSSTKKRTETVRERVSELASLCEIYEEKNGREVSELTLTLYALLDDIQTPFPPEPVCKETDDDELTAAEREDRQRRKAIEALVGSVYRKGKGETNSSGEVDSDDDSVADDDDDDAVSVDESGDGTKRKKEKKKKLLLKNGKIRIGNGSQEKMSIDPKDVSNTNPYTKGKELIEKDNVKEKRAQKKEVQERKEKLIE